LGNIIAPLGSDNLIVDEFGQVFQNSQYVGTIKIAKLDLQHIKPTVIGEFYNYDLEGSIIGEILINDVFNRTRIIQGSLDGRSSESCCPCKASKYDPFQLSIKGNINTIFNLHQHYRFWFFQNLFGIV
jgi:hypothetical protein